MVTSRQKKKKKPDPIFGHLLIPAPLSGLVPFSGSSNIISRVETFSGFWSLQSPFFMLTQQYTLKDVL